MERNIRALAAFCAYFMVGALLLSLACGSAAAQTRAALVKNVDEPGRAPYQHMVEFNTGAPACPAAQFCIVSFPAVPPGKRLVVEQVTALLGVGSTGQANFAAFGDTVVLNGGNLAIVKPGFVAGLSIGGVVFWSLSEPVRVFFEAGAIPKLKLGASANFGYIGNASVHGYLIDATN